MIPGFLRFCAAGMILAGCAANPGASWDADEGQANVIHGYWYHDGTHPNWVSQSSPQAEYNATHGTWLWPPAQDRRVN
jgi:hypothetical protein